MFLLISEIYCNLFALKDNAIPFQITLYTVSVSGDGNSLTMNEMVAQSFVFFIAGFETSATTMTFALFELAMHPEIQDRLRDEIHTVLEKHDGKMTYDSLSEMKYLGQVVDGACKYITVKNC